MSISFVEQWRVESGEWRVNLFPGRVGSLEAGDRVAEAGIGDIEAGARHFPHDVSFGIAHESADFGELSETVGELSRVH